MGIRTLYLCYFGLREPLVQTQVLPYLRELRAAGVSVSLLTFEPNKRYAWSSEALEQWCARLQADGIRWFSLSYHKRPSLPATVYDILAGAWTASRLIRHYGIDVLHARSHVGAAIGALAKWFSGGRLIFDIRGFMPEEYVDAGAWKAGGYLYRLTKVVERKLITAADGFVILTEQAHNNLFPGCSSLDQQGRPIEVIPSCVDLERFQAADALSKEDARMDLGITARRVLAYVGALGSWYLVSEMADFFAAAHQQHPSTFFMILTQSQPELMATQLERLGISERDYLIRRLVPEDIPRYLRAADLGISFIKPCYSKLSSSPTKIAEYLASGLPVISNAGIGDVDELIESDRVGIMVREFNREAYLRALQEAETLLRDAGLSDRCRASALRRFDLSKVGGPRYRRLYDRVMQNGQYGSAPFSVAP